MIRFKIIELIEGNKPKFVFDSLWRTILLFIITLPFRPFTLFSKGYTSIDNSDWEFMHIDERLKIEKRQIAANGFDDCIPYYQLSSTDKKLNELLRFKIFGSFLCRTNEGLLLRQFKSPKKWPNSKLIFINLNDYSIDSICSIKSSFPNWIGYKTNDNEQIDITVEKTKDYKKIIRLMIYKK